MRALKAGKAEQGGRKGSHQSELRMEHDGRNLSSTPVSAHGRPSASENDNPDASPSWTRREVSVPLELVHVV